MSAHARHLRAHLPALLLFSYHLSLRITWDVNFQEGSLQVRRSVNRIGREGMKVWEPKTTSSKRKIMLPKIVLDALEKRRICQEAERLKAGPIWHEQDLIFCSLHGEFIEPLSLMRTFNLLLTKAGLPHMRFHDLRHTAATLLLSKKINAKVVQEMLGHSNISMTLGTYGDILPSMQEDIEEKWDELFGDDQDD
jgi:integrase